MLLACHSPRTNNSYDTVLAAPLGLIVKALTLLSGRAWQCPGRSLLLESLHLAVDLQSAATQASTLLLALASGGWLDGGYKEQVLTAVLARPAGEGRSRALQKLAQQVGRSMRRDRGHSLQQ